MVGIEENLAKQLEHVERANQTATPVKKSPNKSKRTDGPNHDPGFQIHYLNGMYSIKLL